jgi:hypothetical protein
LAVRGDDRGQRVEIVQTGDVTVMPVVLGPMEAAAASSRLVAAGEEDVHPAANRCDGEPDPGGPAGHQCGCSS